METQVVLPDSEPPCTIREVVVALGKVGVTARHEAKSWGDWIHLEGYDTVISIESMRGLTGSATIEHAEGEEQSPGKALLRAFASLGWQGVDEEGPYPLD